MRATSSNFFTNITFVLMALLALAFAGCSLESDVSEPVLQPTHRVASAPAGYYDSVNDSNAPSLRLTLHELIDDHTQIPYTASATDTWDVLETADQDPNNSSNVLDVYRNASYIKHGGGNLDYNREHSWPSSFGFGDEGSGNYPYTDCHHLFICNDSYNSSRSNKPYGSVGNSGSEYITEVNNGVGGGSGFYPGWSNWASTTYWETWMDRRGDVARALFYMDVRYEGGTHGLTGDWEPDLILTNNLSLIENSNTGSNETVAYMGLLSVLLQWHEDDPVDAKEMWRNDTVHSAQGNRNPFIDHPEWAACLFTGSCSGEDITPPAIPSSLTPYPGNGFIDLAWTENTEADLAGYTIYRATVNGGPYSALNAVLHMTNIYRDEGLTNGVPYFYIVTASDITGNESAGSTEVTAAADASGGGYTDEQALVFINEFHYDNDGLDTGEFFEIAGPAGTDLSGWQVIGYNGNGGDTYSTKNLTGIIPDQMEGMGTLAFAFTSMQNGSPDALALVDNLGAVILFISYEGSLVATGGPAAGMTSTDIIVEETSSTPIGHSLQLGGTGSTYGDFTWESPQSNTSGGINANQIFSVEEPVVPSCIAWINEIHYENIGTDEGEFAEISGTAGLDLTDWSLVAYDGTSGLVYDTIALSGSIKEQEEGLGTKGFLMPGLQNDSEGLALVASDDTVFAFISYEGSFTATDGPAAGMVAQDIGVSESDGTARGHSLQLMGKGQTYSAFRWAQPAHDTINGINFLQSFEAFEVEMHR